MDTVLKRNKKHLKEKLKSPPLRWKIYAFTIMPCLLLLAILWLVQTVFLGEFYSNTKSDELKRTTELVINDLEKEDIQDRIFFLSAKGDINILVLDTEKFYDIYSSGQVVDSVTHGLGSYGMWQVYTEAKENNGEALRYYSHVEDFESYSTEQKKDTVFEEYEVPTAEDDEKENGESTDKDNENSFLEHPRRIPRPNIFGNIGKDNNMLYAKIATLSDGSEVMVVADTRITPLDSTVTTLKRQLVFSTIVTLVVALVLSFIVAKRVAKPIEKINKSAKRLAEGKFDTKFEGKGYREIEQLNETLNYASDELGKVDSLQKELMANVSHDMRTPLTMIVGYSEVMRDIPGENNPENVQVIIDEANRLTDFVNSVLDLSKLQSGMEKLELENVDITALLRGVHKRYTSLLSGEECEVLLEYDRQAYVNCDITKITSVLYNLTDNAINYSRSPKRIIIRQKTLQNKVRIEVSDNGEGISPSQLPYIWDRYYKTDKSHKRNVVGSGIGLSIVKQVLQKHGARFGVETCDGVGSTFWFELDTVAPALSDDSENIIEQ